MKRNPIIVAIIVLGLIIIAALVGWGLGHKNNPGVVNGPPPSTTGAGTEVSSLVSYTLPDGWTENTCADAAHKVFVIPQGTSLNCAGNPSAPIALYVDSRNTTDCQQLADVQNVRKHTCSSLYIDGHKSLKALTEDSAGTTTSDYYINTGKGVVAVEYVYTSSNGYQTGFDQLATSVKVKS